MNKDNVFPFKKKNPTLVDAITFASQDRELKVAQVIFGVQVHMGGKMLGTALYVDKNRADRVAQTLNNYYQQEKIILSTAKVVMIEVF